MSEDDYEIKHTANGFSYHIVDKKTGKALCGINMDNSYPMPEQTVWTMLESAYGCNRCKRKFHLLAGAKP